MASLLLYVPLTSSAVFTSILSVSSLASSNFFCYSSYCYVRRRSLLFDVGVLAAFSCRMLLYRFGRVCLLIFFLCKASGVGVSVQVVYSGRERSLFRVNEGESPRLVRWSVDVIIINIISLFFSLIEKTFVLT